MGEVKRIKCKKCGTSNIYGAKVCAKCKTKLVSPMKSCPKCAKKNIQEANTCISCGFKFSRQIGIKKRFFVNLVISFLLMGVLCFLVFMDKVGLVSNLNRAFKVGAAILVVCLFVENLTYNTKDKINYTAESEMLDNNKVTKRMKKFSVAVIILGVLVAIGVLGWFIFFK